MAKLMFYKVIPVAAWKLDKGRARPETKSSIGRL